MTDESDAAPKAPVRDTYDARLEGLEGGKLRARQNEIHGFSQALAAYKIADTNSALNLILTLAFFGQATAARDLLSQVSGRCA